MLINNNKKTATTKPKTPNGPRLAKLKHINQTKEKRYQETQ